MEYKPIHTNRQSETVQKRFMPDLPRLIANLP